MNLILTFTNNCVSTEFQINSEITVKKSLDIISLNTEFKVPLDIKYIYSNRKKKMLGVNYTYEQLQIYSGDQIIVQGEEDGENS